MKFSTLCVAAFALSFSTLCAASDEADSDTDSDSDLGFLQSIVTAVQTPFQTPPSLPQLLNAQNASGAPDVYATSAFSSEASSGYSPSLGDPWFKVTTSYSVTAMFGHVELALPGNRPANLQDVSVNASFGPLQVQAGSTGVTSIAIGFSDPTNLIYGAGIGTSLGSSEPANVNASAHLFNLGAQVQFTPGPGVNNAYGELERTIYRLYGQSTY